MTDEGNLRVDFLAKNILQKNLPICLFLKKVDTRKQTDLINACVKIFHKRLAKQMGKGWKAKDNSALMKNFQLMNKDQD